MDPARIVDPAFLRAFCVTWKIERLEVFGSVARGEERPDSDLDLLVTFRPDARRTLIDQGRMEDEMEVKVGRRVEMASRLAIERSDNPYKREIILGSARRVYPS